LQKTPKENQPQKSAARQSRKLGNFEFQIAAGTVIQDSVRLVAIKSYL